MRQATAKEKLRLLDGQVIELTQADTVVAAGNRPLALAGIMGGDAAAVTLTSTDYFIESANFDAGSIRKSAAAHKLRTESSARFEKGLDPEQTAIALLRFLKIMQDNEFSYTAAPEIICLGAHMSPVQIKLSQEYIDTKLGLLIPETFILSSLEQLGFIVARQLNDYIITVPGFRAQDITQPQDIVEEIGRMWGYDQIVPLFAQWAMKPFSLDRVMRLREIKHFLAYGLLMREQSSYAFYDEAFLKLIDWTPGKTLAVQSPVSEHWQQLVTSLVPNLLRAAHNHAAQYDQIRFFEYGRIWQQGTPHQENQSFALVMIDQKNPLDFYCAKQEITRLYNLIDARIEWVAMSEPPQPWYAPYQTAALFYQGNRIGYAGMARQEFIAPAVHGSAFIAELDADFLLDYKAPVHRYVPALKYPSIERDVSILIGRNYTVDKSHSKHRKD